MRALLATLLLLSLMVPSLQPVQAQQGPGEILVVDFDAGTNSRGTLFRVNPSTGARIVISDFGNAAQGPLGAQPMGVVIDPSGSIIVLDFGAGTNATGALFSVNPATGARTVISDFGNPAQGPLVPDPVALAIDASGNILVIDANAGSSGPDCQLAPSVSGCGALLSVNPTTGARAIISDFGNADQGRTGVNPSGLAIDPSGNIIVVDRDAGTPAAQNMTATSGCGMKFVTGCGALFRLNPITGARALVSDFGNPAQGPTGVQPLAVAIDLSGNIMVLDAFAGTSGSGALFRVNPSTGARSVISDFGNAAQGPTGIANATSVAIDASGNIVFADAGAGTGGPGCGFFGCGALVSVNPAAGVRTIISDFGNTSQGPRGVAPSGVYIVGDTRGGSNVAVGFPQFPGVRLTYSTVATRGITSVTAEAAPNCLKGKVAVLVGSCLRFSFTGIFVGNTTITLPYDPALVPSGRSENQVRLFVIKADGTVEDVTTGVDTVNKRVTGRAVSFQFFAPGLTAAQTVTTTTARTGTQPARRCLIATSTYGSELSPQVQVLREFRDGAVLSTFAGSQFMAGFNAWYYSFSPYIADLIASSSVAQFVMRILLFPMITVLQVASMDYPISSLNSELRVITAGLMAGTLIGVVYLSLPLIAIAMKKKIGLGKHHIAAWLIACAGVMAASSLHQPILMMVSTAALVLFTTILSALMVVDKLPGYLVRTLRGIRQMRIKFVASFMLSLTALSLLSVFPIGYVLPGNEIGLQSEASNALGDTMRKAQAETGGFFGTIRYGGFVIVKLFGQPVKLPCKVLAEGITMDPITGQPTGKRVLAWGFTNSTLRSQGVYEVRGVEAGSYRLTASCPGYPRVSLDREITLQRGQTLHGVDIFIRAGR